jgi:hypothetical protein
VGGHNKTIILLVLVAAMAVTAAPAANAANAPMMPDRIVRSDNNQITGIRVLRAEVARVVYKRFDGRGGVLTIPASNVKEIHWGDSGAFRRALAAYAKNDIKNALAILLELPKNGPREFWYGPYRSLMIGKCHYRLKAYDKALPVFAKITRQYGNSFYLLKAIEGKALAYTRKGAIEQAAKAYAEFDPRGSYASPGSPEPYGKLWQWRGREGMAKAYAELEKKAAAGEIYAGLAKGTGAALAKLPAALKGDKAEITGIYQRALVGSVNALLKAGKTDAALKQIEDVSEQITDRSARVNMYAVVGTALAAKAAKAPDDQKKALQKKALLAYMRVYILYPDQKAQRVKCMLGAAIVSRLLGAPDDNRRAIKLCQAIIAEHPNSPEAKQQAPRLLQELGVR